MIYGIKAAILFGVRVCKIKNSSGFPEEFYAGSGT